MENEDVSNNLTLEVQTLRTAQFEAYAALYAALSDFRRDHPSLPYAAAYASSAFLQRKAAYDATVDKLVALLGPEAHCNLVDCDLWSAYSDFYKDEHGIRPRWHLTRAEVLQRMPGSQG